VKRLKELSSAGQNKPLQAWYLYWIEHLVGDLHQPLHCAESYEIVKTGDEGGNKFKTGVKRGDKFLSLHSYWDAGIEEAAGDGDFEATTKNWVLDADLQPTSAAAKNLDFKTWIADGAKLADDIVYVGIKENKKPSDDYEQKKEALCRRQAVLAGYRLAALLNDILGQ
jgi:hypothetical protein